MKKAVFLLAICTLLSMHVSFAQTAIGAKGGLNMARFGAAYEGESGEGKDYQALIGMNAGIFAQKRFDKLAVQLEVLYSQQGTKLGFTNGIGTTFTDWQANFTYITIPVVVKYFAFKDFNIQAGPQIGLLQSADFNFVDIDGDGAQAQQGFDATDDFKKSDLGIVMGIGWEAPFGLTVDARYVMSLNDINGEADTFRPKYANQVFQLSVGYKILKF